MKKSGLTLSIIYESGGTNYGEGMGNISMLKHITRDGGRQYSYLSRQALRYSMIEQLGWNNTPVDGSGSGDKQVIQFQPDTTIRDYPEIDLFGYMKTEKGSGAKVRSAVVRLTNAISMEPYAADLDFLTNMGLARRCGQGNSIAQSEIHQSFYTYTIAIDLDRIGVDSNDGIALPDEEKAQRVNDFLDCVEFLYRDIRGRRENLAPVFAVGGVYGRKCPFFENRLTLRKGRLQLDPLCQTIDAAGQGTSVGYLSGSFLNDEEIQTALSPVSIGDFFRQLRKEVELAYAGN